MIDGELKKWLNSCISRKTKIQAQKWLDSKYPDLNSRTNAEGTARTFGFRFMLFCWYWSPNYIWHQRRN